MRTAAVDVKLSESFDERFDLIPVEYPELDCHRDDIPAGAHGNNITQSR